MKKKTIFILTALYVLCLFTLLLVSVSVLMSALQREVREQEALESAEPIYVYLERDTAQTDQETLPSVSGYWAREYRDKIGIFYPDGTLYQVLDTYVKTLPKSDQDLLREGIYLEDESELLELIQDYS